jgi:hypothetical protein
MIRPEQFPEIRQKLSKGVPGTYEIDATKPFWAGKSFMDVGNWKDGDFTSRFLVGNVTLRLRGKLVIGPDGNYSFDGKLSGNPDHYRMYGSDHRNETDESLTMLGKLLGSVRHRDYWIHFLGEKPIATSNNLAP